MYPFCLHLAQSGRVGAACRNSCSVPDQKRLRCLWLLPPLSARHSNLRVHRGVSVRRRLRQVSHQTHFIRTVIFVSLSSVFSPPRFILTSAPFVTISLEDYHWSSVSLATVANVLMLPLPWIRAGSSTTIPACVCWLNGVKDSMGPADGVMTPAFISQVRQAGNTT